MTASTNPSTGYTWTVTHNNCDKAFSTSSSVQMNTSGMPGASSQVTWAVTADANAASNSACQMQMAYVRPWEAQNVTPTTVNINVA